MAEFDEMRARHAAEWRDHAQVCSQWREAACVDPKLLHWRGRGGWWETLTSLGITLFVSREYEHLVVAMRAEGGKPRVSFFPMPHPSGMVVDRARSRLFIASTRNPNQVFGFRPVRGLLRRSDTTSDVEADTTMIPVCSRYYPGSLYLHDLALFGPDLYGNAVGHNAVVRLGADGKFEYRWWPKCVAESGRLVRSSNFIQLNSIAAGSTLQKSFFTASSDHMARRRPGHLNFPVDRRGVIFSGRTREPICTGLTRPHSARLAEGKVWVANSGYGEVGFVSDGRLEVVSRIPGWTRGLCIVNDVIFVAASRVIPRFSCYAPGVDVASSVCGVFAIGRETGAILGSLEWPRGNQVFALDWIEQSASGGFPFEWPRRRHGREKQVFYSYLT